MKTSRFFAHSAVFLASGVAFATQTYQDDVDFLRKHTGIIELVAGQARVAIAPAYQARVMTSTATGPGSNGFGWINPEVIAAGIKPESERSDLTKHIHVFGGEERLWFGPEGGPFSLFFPPKVPQVFENWKTPAAIDTDAFQAVDEPSSASATFSKSIKLPNRAGTVFTMEVRRKITLASPAELAKALGGPLPDGVCAVGYTTANTVQNAGDQEWTRQTGAPSIWMLGMFKPSPETTIVIPFISGNKDQLGPIATTDYFGEIPENRIRFTDSVLFYQGDGKERGKLGLSPKRSKGVAGSWQKDTGALTLLRIIPTSTGKNWPYVDSQWKEDGDPFGGDVINSYNDGPPEPGAKPLGPFYELETSSPALFLKPGESFTHEQTTLHLTGPREALDAISQKNLGVGLDEIEKFGGR